MNVHSHQIRVHSVLLTLFIYHLAADETIKAMIYLTNGNSKEICGS